MEHSIESSSLPSPSKTNSAPPPRNSTSTLSLSSHAPTAPRDPINPTSTLYPKQVKESIEMRPFSSSTSAIAGESPQRIGEQEQEEEEPGSAPAFTTLRPSSSMSTQHTARASLGGAAGLSSVPSFAGGPPSLLPPGQDEKRGPLDQKRSLHLSPGPDICAHEPPQPSRDEKKTDPAALWKARYFERAKTCLDTAVVADRTREEKLEYFKLYLGPPLYQAQLRENEKLLVLHLKKMRADAENILWDHVIEAIRQVPARQRTPTTIGVYYNRFLDNVVLFHKQWKKECLALYQQQVLEPNAKVLLAAGHPAEKIQQNFTRPQLRQYSQQLDSMKRTFDKHPAMQAFLTSKDLNALEARVKVECARLQKVADEQSDAYKSDKEGMAEKIEIEAENFYREQERLIREAITTFYGTAEGSQEIARWYGSHLQLSEAEERVLLGKPISILNGTEMGELIAVKEKIVQGFMTELRQCWATADLCQSQICDADGNTLLHHALAQLANPYPSEQREFLLKFVAALYEHGAFASVLNHKKEDVYAYSKVFDPEKNVFNTGLGWKLLTLHVKFTAICGEAQKHIKDSLLHYNQFMPAFLMQNTVGKLIDDYYGTKRTYRFMDVWELGLALTRAVERLDDEIFFDKAKERKEQPQSRASTSKLFTSLGLVETGVKEGRIIEIHATAEDIVAENTVEISTLKRNFIELQATTKQQEIQQTQMQAQLQDQQKQIQALLKLLEKSQESRREEEPPLKPSPTARLTQHGFFGEQSGSSSSSNSSSSRSTTSPEAESTGPSPQASASSSTSQARSASAFGMSHAPAGETEG